MTSFKTARAGAAVLLGCASAAAISGVLVAATPPPGANGLVFLPLIVALIGVVAAGHFVGWHAVGYVLVPVFLLGWYLGFVFTSGAIPPVLSLSIGIVVVALIYPLGDAKRVVLVTAGTTAVMSTVSGYLWFFDSTPLRIIAVTLNVIAVIAFASAAVRSIRGPRTRKRASAVPIQPTPYRW